MHVYLLFIDLDDGCEPVLCGVFESAKAAREKPCKYTIRSRSLLKNGR